MSEDHDELHRGLQHDLARHASLQERRRLLRWLVAGGTTALVTACGGGSSGGTSDTTTATTGTATGTTSGGTVAPTGACLANASETNGPYPADGSNTVNGMVSNVLTQTGVVRRDIRSSFGGSSGIATGIPLTLTLQLLNSNGGCAALSGYALYLWHCTAGGAYSLYSAGVQDENYLRGVQVSDGSGMVTFQTVFPGCYAGRYPHIHFEVYRSLGEATLYTNRVLTSQLALPAAACSAAYGQAGYGSSAANFARTSIAGDNVFGDNTAAQIAQMTAALSGDVASGYLGSVVVGVPA